MTCSAPLEERLLVDYFAGDLTSAESDAVDEHLLSCALCAQAAEATCALIQALRAQTPPIVRARDVARLQARGMRVVENTFLPGQRSDVEFAGDVDLLIHRLSGFDLARATRIDFSMVGEASGRVLVVQGDVPFDPETGAVLIACRQHYADMDPDTVAKLQVAFADGHEARFEYTIVHRFLAPT